MATREKRLRELFDAVVFDLDGTLVDTAPDLSAHVNDVLAELDRSPLALDAVRGMIGDGAWTLLHRGLELSGGVPADFDALFARYLERYTARPMRYGAVFAGVVEVLEGLQAGAVKLGVCTNKAQAPTDALLRATGLDRFFRATIGGDALPVKKPDAAHLRTVLDRLEADHARAVFVGDSATDLATARAAGVPCVLVSFGYTRVAARDLGADRVIDHFADLPAALHALAEPA